MLLILTTYEAGFADKHHALTSLDAAANLMLSESEGKGVLLRDEEDVVVDGDLDSIKSYLMTGKMLTLRENDDLVSEMPSKTLALASSLNNACIKKQSLWSLINDDIANVTIDGHQCFAVLLNKDMEGFMQDPPSCLSDSEHANEKVTFSVVDTDENGDDCELPIVFPAIEFAKPAKRNLEGDGFLIPDQDGFIRALNIKLSL